MPDGFRIAAAYVDVTPNLDNFEADLKAKLDAAQGSLKIPAVLDAKTVAADAEKVRAQVEDQQPAKIPTDLDTSKVPAQREKTKQETEGQSPVKIPTTLTDPVTAAWRAKVDADLKAIAKDSLKIPMSPDAEKFRADLAAQLTSIRSTVHGDIPLEPADMADFKAKVQAAADAASAGVKEKIPVEVDPSSLDKMKADTNKAAQNAGQGGGGLMAVAIGAGLVGAGPLIGGAMAAMGTAGLAALVVKVDAGNEQIKQSWSGLATDAKSSAEVMSASMVGPISQGLNQIDDLVIKDRGLLEQMFTAAAADLPIFTSGVTALANQALPAMNDALQHSRPLAQGVANDMSAIGSVIASLMTSTTGYAGSMGVELTQLGTVVKNLGTDLGSMLPGLSTGFGATLKEVNGLVAGLRPVAPALGDIAGAATPVIGSMMLLGKIGTPIDNAGQSIQKFAANMTDAEGNSTRMGSAVGGAGKAVSAFGSALPFVGAAIGAVSDLVQVSDQKFQNWQAQILQSSSSASAAMTNFTQTAAFVPGAWQKLFEGMSPAQIALANYNIEVGKFGVGSEQAAKAARDVGSAQADTAAQTQYLNETIGTLSAKEDITSSGTHALASSLLDASNQASNLSSYLTAVETHLAEMADHGLEKANDATSAFYQGLQQMVSTLQSATGPILTTNGELDLTSQRGQAVLTAIEGARNSMTEYAGAMQNANQPQSAINAGLNTMENNLIGTLEKMGLSKTAAQNLAAAYLAIPTSITTNVNAVTAPAQSAIDKVVTQNNGRTITLYVNTQTGTFTGAGGVHGNATGGILSAVPFADGGVAAPAMAPIAQVIPANTPRLIGDNLTTPESYIPLDPNSQRSQAILAATNQIMGQSGAGTVNHNQFYITSTDPMLVTQELMAQQQWIAMTARAA